MKRTYTILLTPGEPDEGGYYVRVPALPGCITEGDTLEEAIANAKEVIEGYVLSLQDCGIPVPDGDSGTGSLITAVTVEV